MTSRLATLMALSLVALSVPAMADTVLASFEGGGSRTTRPFHVDGPWELRWTVRVHTSFTVRPANGGSSVAFANGPTGNGSSYVPRAGDFIIEVSALGDEPWTLQVVSMN